ncbi:RagB/SusD family nutrient uptake outer membrane protein [Mucilaginibacter ginsenosidivorax]|uniref:RagB/SusD family nutrient uptake outer membrane protein n=1 Tax=Mucilaginibacter ginsenosidivorax TaxID=862126 RepID=A0A5B8W5J8_9SPHI|nr:RagB/SusD family nutrient uptake outer membrane protein [Mucilaginibacter ginsenosidivorax]QEC78859.1 RagB/SusD family nutrient uptake outer membrane protein [Mucilaginibacter ginsenosidivorax]
MKNQISTFIYFVGFSCLLLITGSCKKQDAFLDTKPNQALSVPASLGDLQSLLYNEGVFNLNDPALGEMSTDDYYFTDADWASLYLTQEKNTYTWDKEFYDAGSVVLDWNLPYQQVYIANTVLDYLPKISYSASQQTQANQIRGAALFYRSIAFYNLVQTFALPYDVKTAATDLGIPLRLNSDPNITSIRATEQQCYDLVIQDLKISLPLLPVIPVYKTLPSRPAANALLSRVYLAIGDFNNAYKYANDCLSDYNTLVDYNSLNPGTNSYLSSTFLSEDIFHSVLEAYSNDQPNSVSIADTLLYKSYANNDLRKSVFFTPRNGAYYFRGTYDIKGYSFSGIATDEVYLVRAECNARLGNTADAIKDLNTLLVKRWKSNTFIPYTASSSDDALKQILLERRKELLYRGLRWTDLRRLNKDSRFAITLTRNLNGVVYSLPPNDKRYALPIPDNEIQLSGIAQNVR